MELTTTRNPAVRQQTPRTWLVRPRRIGFRTFRGECRIVRVRHISYQHLSTTFGQMGGVFGLATAGRGVVSGGGGFVDTAHQAIVSAVLEDEQGRHAVQDLPAAAAVLEGGLVRIDAVNGRMVAVTNLSGRQDRIIILGPSAFIGGVSFTTLHGVLLLAALVAGAQIPRGHESVALPAALLLGVLPMFRLCRMRLAGRRRDRLKDYMVEVMS